MQKAKCFQNSTYQLAINKIFDETLFNIDCGNKNVSTKFWAHLHELALLLVETKPSLYESIRNTKIPLNYWNNAANLKTLHVPFLGHFCVNKRIPKRMVIFMMLPLISFRSYITCIGLSMFTITWSALKDLRSFIVKLYNSSNTTKAIEMVFSWVGHWMELSG